jgi:hypothetical protein
MEKKLEEEGEEGENEGKGRKGRYTSSPKSRRELSIRLSGESGAKWRVVMSTG